MEGPRDDPGPPAALAAVGAQRWAIGLDVGGTKIGGGLVELSTGRLVGHQTVPTGATRGGAAVLADALSLAATLLAEAAAGGLAVEGIGVGVAELVDARGAITSDQTIAWRGQPVQERFRALAPAVVQSDVRAAALAEALFGAGQPYTTFAYLTVGTGISYCLVQGGRPYAGARGNALVLASSPHTTTCPDCGAELRPILEEFASGPALVARYNAAHTGRTAATRGHDVLAAAAGGDEAARHVVRTAGAALGVAAGLLADMLDPEALVVGGGLGVAGGLYWDSFVASTRAHIWAEATRGLPILPAALGPTAGVVGAAAIWRLPTEAAIDASPRVVL